MTPEQFRRVETIYHRALAAPLEDRSALITDMCGGDPLLMNEVTSLLDHHGEDARFLESPAANALDAAFERSFSDVGPGGRIGSYRIERLISTGGMGMVWLAHRDDDQYQKQVAIKIIRHGITDSTALERFQFEKQTLAQLEHAGIAQLIDAGVTSSDLPYFVMEYVDGVPIDQFLNSQTEDRFRIGLALFLETCQAVAFAHRKLVIHRDIKPGNILVTKEGKAKLLDFGIAKSIDTDGTQILNPQTMGSAFVGTIAYAAPEQVSGQSSDVDVRTDIYSLGVTLYRILTDQCPFELDGSLTDAVRKITETIPLPPSRRHPTISRDIDAIVLKSLAKAPDERYQSVDALIDDVERHLRGEPVNAMQSTSHWRWYVVRKSIQRHRLKIATAMTLILMIACTIVMLSRSARLLEFQRDVAQNALHVSNIERGRMHLMSGNTELAERILWQEYFEATRELDGFPCATLDEPMSDGLAYWSLWEFYRRQPCSRSTIVQRGAALTTFSPDGRSLIGIEKSGLVRITGTDTGDTRELQLSNLQEPISIMVDDGGDSMLVVDSSGATATVNLESLSYMGRREFEIRATSADADPNIEVVAMGDARGYLHIHYLGKNMDGKHVRVSDTPVAAVAVSRNGDLICAATDKGQVVLLSAEDGDIKWKKDLHDRRIVSLDFSPDGQLVASAGADHIVNVTRVPTGDLQTSFTEHVSHLGCASFSPDGKLIASGGQDKTVHLWRPNSGDVVRSLTSHSNLIRDIQFVDDEYEILTFDGLHIRRWDGLGDSFVTTFGEADGTTFAVSISKDGRDVAFASGDGDNKIRIINRRTDSSKIMTLDAHKAAVVDVEFVNDGDGLISCGYDGRVIETDLTSKKQIWATQLDSAQNSIALSPDESSFAVAGNDGKVTVWDRRTRKLIRRIDSKANRVPTVAISPDGRWLAASTGFQSQIVIWNFTSGEEVIRLDAHQTAIRPICFTPDSGRIITGGDDNRIAVWTIPDGQLSNELMGHTQDVFSLAVSRDGSYLASGSRNGVIRFWSLTESRELLRFDYHDDMVFDLEFDPIQFQLISCGRDQGVRRLDLSSFANHIEGNCRSQYETVNFSQPR